MVKLEDPFWRMSKWDSLPDVVLDIILGRILPPEDIRSFHQVCRNWSKAVETRAKVNERRRTLVNRTYSDKENNEQNSILDIRTNSSKSTDDKNSGKKPGSGQTVYRSVLRSSASSNASSTRSGQNTPKPSINRSTPKSRYQIQYEAGRKLKEGEVLSPCPECRSPVPSPSLSRLPLNVCVRVIGLSDLNEESETSESIISKNNQTIQYWQCQCPTCSYRFCSRCKWKEHPGKPCREIDGESAFINESDRLRNSKSSTHNNNSKILGRRKKNQSLKRIANL